VAALPTLNDLDAAWFTTTLRNAGKLADNVTVTSATLSALSAADGMMSQVMRCTLTYDGLTDAPKTIVVKGATSDAHRRFIAQVGNMYLREVRFYQHLAAEAPVRIPGGIFADIDPETADFVLVLEDVGQLRSIDQVAGATADEAVRAIRCMAQWHAKWWGSPKLDALSEHFYAWNGEFNKGAFPMVFGQNWSTAKEAYADRLPPEIVHIGDHFVENVNRILDDLMEPNTLVHSDFRADNLMLDGNEIVLIDFQLVSVGCGMLDFAFFVGQSLTVEFRTANFDALLTIYLAELAAHGVEFSRADALDKYKRALVFGLAWPVSLSGSLAQLDDRGKALAYAMLDRFVRAVMDSGAHLLRA
jgi:aminoglycoside/choline kinase family phosphotransferase